MSVDRNPRLVRRLLWWTATVAVVAFLAHASSQWLEEHPEHNPWAPLDLRDPVGWATAAKLARLRTEAPACRSTLVRSNVAFEPLPPVGADQCRRDDRIRLTDVPLSPDTPSTTCSVSVAFEMWMEKTVRPSAETMLGSPLRRIEHLGAFSCRRLYGRDEGAWSQHATANAIDIAAFVLEDGRRISLLDDWGDGTAESAFLAEVRDGACTFFSTVLTPDYNAAHRDHFHLDQQPRGLGGVCR